MNFPTKQEVSSGGTILIGPLIVAEGLKQIGEGNLPAGFALVLVGVGAVFFREKFKPGISK